VTRHAAQTVLRSSLDVRPGVPADADSIIALLAEHARKGKLLPRTRQEVIDNIDLFRVAENEGRVIGCGALEIFTTELAEVRSLAVADSFKTLGIGRQLVEQLAGDARARGHRKLMALTYEPGFFHRLGFETVLKEMFPEKVWGICVRCHKFNHCDEIAVLKYLAPA